jgi:UDP-2-acetamido-3-amino-2,3-dideoxy-glucuronate N-acetyltransferase
MVNGNNKLAVPFRAEDHSESPMIAADVTLEENTKIHHPDLVNLYGCHIGAGTTIGAFVEIRKDVVIGRNVKIQAHVFIPEGVVVEDGVFLGPHVCFTNDRYPRAVGEEGELLGVGDWEMENTRVKKGASIGANATILCGLTIGAHAAVGAGAVVTSDVPDFSVVVGVPARVVGDIRERRKK